MKSIEDIILNAIKDGDDELANLILIEAGYDVEKVNKYIDEQFPKNIE